ncbi:gas vesicle protein [Xanthobacter agilis]|uniref:Uncharacterized protein n=1 Tax=Xanthobacter agilis TaxID=47492 RepID=A0ABU0LFS4_XANAG|nr:gas vesicle protein [Xanthobacter agilis]MDQ0505958.1 hypothetical protein [Xanthobacter agilis]
MNRDVKDLVKRLTLHPSDLGGPSYMQMIREREEVASVLEGQVAWIARVERARDPRSEAAVERERDAFKAGVAYAEVLARQEKQPDLTDIGAVYQIAHDGFEGEVIGSYRTREGKDGVVLQQVGTRVVHVYGCKWLQK